MHTLCVNPPSPSGEGPGVRGPGVRATGATAPMVRATGSGPKDEAKPSHHQGIQD